MTDKLHHIVDFNNKEKKPFSSLLSEYGGLSVVKSFIPDVEFLDPNNEAARNIFLTENRFKDQRENLVRELRGWITLLDCDKSSATEFIDKCKREESKYQILLSDNVTAALVETRRLETSYRVLDSFFKNAGDDNVENLRLINVNKDAITDPKFKFIEEVDLLLKNAFDRLSLRESYSLMVMPGYMFQDPPTLLQWAAVANKYKLLLVIDHADDVTFDNMLANTKNYRDSDQVLQNVVMTANWIVGRNSEKLSDNEKYDPAFYIPPSGALAGRLYDESFNIAQSAGGKKYGTLKAVKGVRVNLLKMEIIALLENQVVPMIFSEGRVMAFNNTTLYNGDNDALKEYPIVRVFDWVKKVLLNCVYEVVLENWEPFISSDNLKNKIQNFLDQYQGYGNLFKKYDIKDPVQDPITKRVTVEISLTPYYATKSFLIKLAADRHTKECITK